MLSGPPVVIFTWRHWANFTGQFRDRIGNGELLELYGLCRVTVNDKLKILDLEVSKRFFRFHSIFITEIKR